MDRTDVVVRRRLVQKMRLRFEARGMGVEPDEAERAAFLTQHPGRFSAPARVRITHVFAPKDPVVLASQLREHHVAPERALSLGAPFLHPARLPALSERELAGRFGPAFAAAVMRAEVGAWTGPIESAYGPHLVYVHESRPGGVMPLDSVRREVRQAWYADRRERALQEALEELRKGREVRVVERRPE
jgi:hypothetical protein